MAMEISSLALVLLDTTLPSEYENRELLCQRDILTALLTFVVPLQDRVRGLVSRTSKAS
jgi:hypothetical protein